MPSLNRKITLNKSKHLLIENEFKELETFDSSYFIGKGHFEEDGAQYYWVFPPMYRYFKRVVNSEYILSWKPKGLSVENITPPSAPHSFLNPSLSYLSTKTRVRFSGSCLKQERVTNNHGKIVNIYIVFEINKNDNTTNSDPTLENFFLKQLVWLKILILISTNILDMVLDLIEKELFHLVMELVQM